MLSPGLFSHWLPFIACEQDFTLLWMWFAACGGINKFSQDVEGLIFLHLDDIFHPLFLRGPRPSVTPHVFVWEKGRKFLKRRKWFQGCDLWQFLRYACEGIQGSPTVWKFLWNLSASQNGIEPRGNYFRTQMHKINQYKAQMFTDARSKVWQLDAEMQRFPAKESLWGHSLLFGVNAASLTAFCKTDTEYYFCFSPLSIKKWKTFRFL